MKTTNGICTLHPVQRCRQQRRWWPVLSLSPLPFSNIPLTIDLLTDLEEESGTPSVISGWCQCIFCERVKNIFEDVHAGAPIKFRFVLLECEKSTRLYLALDAIRIEMTFLPRNFSSSFSYRHFHIGNVPSIWLVWLWYSLVASSAKCISTFLVILRWTRRNIYLRSLIVGADSRF